MPGKTLRPWLPEEDRVVDHHARRLVAGSYRSIYEAARACMRDFGHRHSSLGKPEPRRRVAVRPHPFNSVRQRVRLRLNTLGLLWTNRRLTPADAQLADRYARSLAQGQYHTASEAATACLAELARRPNADKRARPLSHLSIRECIYTRARRLRQPWSHTRWSPAEARIADRFARAVMRGDYASVTTAARDCHVQLRRLWSRLRGSRGPAGPEAGRSFEAIFARLIVLTRAKGLRRAPRWRTDELRILDHYLRAIYAGRYRTVRTAAKECARELRKRGLHRRAASLSSRHSTGRRATAIYTMMTEKLRHLGLPRREGKLAAGEQELAERYAQAVKDGKYENSLEATHACLKELSRLNAKAGKASPLSVRRLADRSANAVHIRILAAAHRLGLRANPRWTVAETKVLDGWTRWYDRYHRVQRLAPLKEASLGLHEDLDKMGSTRSVAACRDKLQIGRRRLHGLA
jgi:hypothetical protein